MQREELQDDSHGELVQERQYVPTVPFNLPPSEISPFRAGTALQAMRRYIFSDSQSENLFHFFTEIF